MLCLGRERDDLRWLIGVEAVNDVLYFAHEIAYRLNRLCRCRVVIGPRLDDGGQLMLSISRELRSVDIHRGSRVGATTIRYEIRRLRVAAGQQSSRPLRCNRSH